MVFELLGEIVLQVVGEVLGYGTGRFIIPLLSLGAARGERIGEPRQHAFFKRVDNTVVISGGVTTFIGILFWVGLGVAGYFLYRAQ